MRTPAGGLRGGLDGPRARWLGAAAVMVSGSAGEADTPRRLPPALLYFFFFFFF